VSTLTVSLPSTIAETPRRPWEAITIASHPFLSGRIDNRFVGELVFNLHHIAGHARILYRLEVFSGNSGNTFLYSSGVSVTMPGSTAKTWKGSDTVTAVTLALRAFASPIP
jgi:hypothetical protein